MRPDRAIYWTLGNFLKPSATINLPKSPTFLGNFCKGFKMNHLSRVIIFGNFYRHLAIFSGHTTIMFDHLQKRGRGWSIINK